VENLKKQKTIKTIYEKLKTTKGKFISVSFAFWCVWRARTYGPSAANAADAAYTNAAAAAVSYAADAAIAANAAAAYATYAAGIADASADAAAAELRLQHKFLKDNFGVE